MHENKISNKPGANQNGSGMAVETGVSGQDATLHTGLKPWESDSVQHQTWWGGRSATWL